MTSSFTTNKSIEKPANGDYVDTWNVPVNADWDIIDAAFGGVTSLNVTGASGTIVLTAAQYRPPMIVITGTLTANVTYQVPSGVGGMWTILNGATGAFTIYFASAGGGTYISLGQGFQSFALCDGTNVTVGAAAAGANGDITSLNNLTTPLSVSQGGTGSATAAGARANLVVAGTAVANNFTATQSFPGTSSVVAMVPTNVAEPVTINAAGATSTINLYTSAQSILYYSNAATGNWTINLTHSAGTTMNAALPTGQAMTVAFLATQGSTAYYNNVVQVDGSTSGVTTVWLGGAPTAGNASGVDVYSYTVIKTGSATFTVLATLSQFK